MSEPRYWFIQKPVANNVPLERNGAVFVRHQPTVSEQNCEWVKVWSSEDLSKEMGMGVTKWVELNRKVRELEAQLKEAQDCLLLIRGRARGARYADDPGLLLFRIIEDVTSYITSYMDFKKREEAKP